MAGHETSQVLHATTIAVGNQACLILGPSGAGKSSLALQLLALGARLVSDDRTEVRLERGAIHAQAPAAIVGMIEARGVGLLRAPLAPPTRVTLVVDLTQSETARLPERHVHTLLGITLPCLYHAPSPHFAASVLLYLREGLAELP